MRITRRQLKQIIKEVAGEVDGEDTGSFADLPEPSLPSVPEELTGFGDLETPGWYTEIVGAIDSLGRTDQKVVEKINAMLRTLRTIRDR